MISPALFYLGVVPIESAPLVQPPVESEALPRGDSYLPQAPRIGFNRDPFTPQMLWLSIQVTPEGREFPAFYFLPQARNLFVDKAIEELMKDEDYANRKPEPISNNFVHRLLLTFDGPQHLSREQYKNLMRVELGFYHEYISKRTLNSGSSKCSTYPAMFFKGLGEMQELIHGLFGEAEDGLYSGDDHQRDASADLSRSPIGEGLSDWEFWEVIKEKVFNGEITLPPPLYRSDGKMMSPLDYIRYVRSLFQTSQLALFNPLPQANQSPQSDGPGAIQDVDTQRRKLKELPPDAFISESLQRRITDLPTIKLNIDLADFKRDMSLQEILEALGVANNTPPKQVILLHLHFPNGITHEIIVSTYEELKNTQIQDDTLAFENSSKALIHLTYEWEGNVRLSSPKITWIAVSVRLDLRQRGITEVLFIRWLREMARIFPGAYVEAPVEKIRAWELVCKYLKIIKTFQMNLIPFGAFDACLDDDFLELMLKHHLIEEDEFDFITSDSSHDLENFMEILEKQWLRDRNLGLTNSPDPFAYFFERFRKILTERPNILFGNVGVMGQLRDPSFYEDAELELYPLSLREKTIFQDSKIHILRSPAALYGKGRKKYVLVLTSNGQVECRMGGDLHEWMLAPGDRIIGAGKIKWDPIESVFLVDGRSDDYPTFAEGMGTPRSGRTPSFDVTGLRAVKVSLERILNKPVEIISKVPE